MNTNKPNAERIELPGDRIAAFKYLLKVTEHFDAPRESKVVRSTEVEQAIAEIDALIQEYPDLAKAPQAKALLEYIAQLEAAQPTAGGGWPTAEALAILFHDAYEKQAKGAGWETQESCRVAFADLPEANRKTMIATCKDVLSALLDKVGG